MHVTYNVPKSIKKSLRYIDQEVNNLEKLEVIEKLFNNTIFNKKKGLKEKGILQVKNL